MRGFGGADGHQDPPAGGTCNALMARVSEALAQAHESPVIRRIVIVCAALVAASAAPGAIALVVAGHGTESLPHALLARTPYETFLIPGLLLGIVVAGSSLACAVLTWKRSSLAVDSMLLAGGALTLWIVVERLTVPSSWLQVVYGGLGITLLVLGVWEGHAGREPRHRWLIGVTTAETAGYLVPSLVGILATRAGWPERDRAIAVVAGGLLEGLALGAGMAWALPVTVRRLRFALLTSLGGGLVWAVVMSVMLVAGSLRGAVAIVIFVLAGLVGLASIGTAQWLELRHHARNARRWIVWTAVAWCIALPMSFAPGPFVDETTPLPVHVVFWGCGGLVMAFALALVLWRPARRLVPVA